jgi:hypothetical protein
VFVPTPRRETLTISLENCMRETETDPGLIKLRMKKIFFVTTCLAITLTQAAPILPQHLRLHTAMPLSADLSIELASTWFPRTIDGDNYVWQINVPAWGRYPSGSSTASVLVDNSKFTNPPPYGVEHRTVLPFRGANSKTYILASGTSSAFLTSPFNLRTNMSRYDFTGSNRVDIMPPWPVPVEYYDWVDDDTILFTTQTFPVEPEVNGRLYLADVVANPFSMSSNTTWNANGYVQSSVTNAGMQVRVGGKYNGYAYYGGGVDEMPNHMLFALNLATGVETQLGDENILTNRGVRMVVERDGYLYVELVDRTTGNSWDNEIRVYNMTSATELGSLYTTYDKELLDTITGNPIAQPIWGIDPTPDGSKFVIGTKGFAYELGGILLNITRSGNNIILKWPMTINGVVQSSASLSPANFTDMSPQPAILIEGDHNTATIPLGSGNLFYRLREGP